jgi:hypothetical protein
MSTASGIVAKRGRGRPAKVQPPSTSSAGFSSTSTSTSYEESGSARAPGPGAVTTKSFTLGQTEYNIRIIGTEDDPWFVAADIGRVLGIERIKDQLGSYKKGTEKGAAVA